MGAKRFERPVFASGPRCDAAMHKQRANLRRMPLGRASNASPLALGGWPQMLRHAPIAAAIEEPTP